LIYSIIVPVAITEMAAVGIRTISVIIAQILILDFTQPDF
jgi:hypothetical protein